MILQFLVLLLSGLGPSLAQTTSASCSPGYEWASNELHQSPCLVSAYLAHQCSPETDFNVPPLSGSQYYLPPSGQQANACECSSIYFSLLSACATCQGSSLGTFTSWTSQCSQNNISLETYPLATPNGTQISAWAYLPLSNGAFDVIAAGRNATGDPSFGRNPNSLSTGAIIGLTVGSVVALILIIVAVLMYWRMKKLERRRGQPLGSESTHDRSGVRYDKIEGPPRRPWSFWPKPVQKVISYRAGLNFDLNKNRQGDLVELSGAHGTKSERASRDSRPSTAFASRTSLETGSRNASRSHERDRSADLGSQSQLPKLFSRAKEVKPRTRARLDLADEGSASPTDRSPQFVPESSPGRVDRQAVLDM